jgi:peptidyl-prolyl cis-trans isomerase A (cyclophilin A)
MLRHVRGRLALVATVLVSCGPALAPGQASRFPPELDDLVMANVAVGDPHAGRFSYEDATAGLPEHGELRARLVTDEGEIECVLDPGHAPLTVANFVGLARGVRPFRTRDGPWLLEPFYDDTVWHRAHEGQFVQAGRRAGLDDGGFFLQDEISVGDSFDRAGVLAMANNGTPHSGSTQFFITTGPAKHLAGAHTVFGQCDDAAAVRRIERRVIRGKQDLPRLLRVDVSRG